MNVDAWLIATVFFKCPPTASVSGMTVFSVIGSGTYPLALRNTVMLPLMHRTTESSKGRRIGRVIVQKIIGNARQPRKCLLVLNTDRLIVAVTAGGNDRRTRLTQQQMV